jgi:hypothetical protein
VRTTRIMAAALIVGGGLAHFAQAQKPGIGRTELTHRDFGDSLREVIQTRVDFAPGAFPKHSHPGVEVAYVLEGSLEYSMASRRSGSPPGPGAGRRGGRRRPDLGSARGGSANRSYAPTSFTTSA